MFSKMKSFCFGLDLNNVIMAQLAKALHCNPRGPWFESCWRQLHVSSLILLKGFNITGSAIRNQILGFTLDSKAEEKKIREAYLQASKFEPGLSPARNDTPGRIFFTVGETWLIELEKEFKAEYFKKLSEFLIQERMTHMVYPPACEIFSFTNSFRIYDVKVVILGQDPYIRREQAHGLAFSVRKGVDIPKSLKNIYRELANDVADFVPPNHGCLNGWASEGVLLLNTCLTVRAGKSNSHKGKGWETFTDAIITWINENMEHCVFLLWGNDAKRKSVLINEKKHLVLTAAHPSPLSAHRGFLGCKHFSKANRYLQNHHKVGINWNYLP